ncbi:MAG: hypothetical protein IPJ41_07735 [Phycisphaerales bacterium]|nr:hypothetical protein [Phycisphaerales bacterium]
MNEFRERPQPDVKESLQTVLSRLPDFVHEFYGMLFAEHPGLRPMFSDDMVQQRNNLVTALALVAKYVENVRVLEIPLRELGARHLAYGARPEHYPIVRDTMLRAMRKVAGPEWTPAVDQAWADALAAVSEIMMLGASEVGRNLAA